MSLVLKITFPFSFVLISLDTNVIFNHQAGSTVVYWFSLSTRNQRVMGSNPTWCVCPYEDNLSTIVSSNPGVVNEHLTSRNLLYKQYISRVNFFANQDFKTFLWVVNFAIEEERMDREISIIHSFACALCTVLLVLLTQVTFSGSHSECVGIGGKFFARRWIREQHPTRKIRENKPPRNIWRIQYFL